MVASKESSKVGLMVDLKVGWKECSRDVRSVVESAVDSVAS